MEISSATSAKVLDEILPQIRKLIARNKKIA
jgi:hypothetical protein